MRPTALKTAAVAAIALTLILTLAPAPSAGPVRLTYANFPPAPTFPCVQMERWKAEVEKQTEGAVRIDTFPGGTLLGAKDMFDGVVAGQADIGCLCMAYQPGRFIVTNATSLPLGIPSARVGSLVLFDLFRQHKPKAFDQVKVLTLFTTAPANIMSRKPIRTLEDISGVDLRASGGAAQILKAWGANQVGMPMSATPEALQKGVVDGLFSSLEVMKDLKFAEHCKFITRTDTVIYPFAVVMNQDRWEALPESVKKVMDKLAREQAQWTGDYMDGHVEEAVEWSKTTHNVDEITLDATEEKRWDALLAPIVEGWIAEHKADFPAEAIVDDIRQLTRQYAGQ